jgi:hypothetical protein
MAEREQVRRRGDLQHQRTDERNEIRREVKDDVLVLEQWNNMPSSLDSPSSKCALSKVLTARANERPGI